MGVVPPLDPHPAIGNDEFPVRGSLPQRVLARKLLNDALKRKAEAVGIGFIPIPKSFETRIGSMKPHLSDGAAHIAMDYAKPIVTAVSERTGVELSFKDHAPVTRMKRHLARLAAVTTGRRDKLWPLGYA